MLENSSLRKKRRQIILEGISQDLKPSEISSQLGANRWSIMRDIKYMRRNGDLGLKQAEEAQDKVREKKVSLFNRERTHFKQNERFLRMMGMTLQEKSFRNMIDFNKQALLNILRSVDQHAAISKLSKTSRKTLKKHGIITKRWQGYEITERAVKYLKRAFATF